MSTQDMSLSEMRWNALGGWVLYMEGRLCNGSTSEGVLWVIVPDGIRFVRGTPPRASCIIKPLLEEL